MTIARILAAISRLPSTSTTHLIGISGFGGSGKSTLARELAELVPRCVRVRGDDFLDPAQSHLRSTNWAGVERLRLRGEVIEPLRTGITGSFRRFDWSAGVLGAAEPLPSADVVVVDAIGLFHPELAGAFDLTVWVDVELEKATEQGKSRDRRLGRDHDRLWDDVWVPNERDFADQYNPRAVADLHYVPVR